MVPEASALNGRVVSRKKAKKVGRARAWRLWAGKWEALVLCV